MSYCLACLLKIFKFSFLFVSVIFQIKIKNKNKKTKENRKFDMKINCDWIFVLHNFISFSLRFLLGNVTIKFKITILRTEMEIKVQIDIYFNSKRPSDVNYPTILILSKNLFLLFFFVVVALGEFFMKCKTEKLWIFFYYLLVEFWLLTCQGNSLILYNFLSAWSCFSYLTLIILYFFCWFFLKHFHEN